VYFSVGHFRIERFKQHQSTRGRTDHFSITNTINNKNYVTMSRASVKHVIS